MTFIGYALTAFSINVGLLSLLFFGRLLTGLFSGNLSICLASISDLSEDAHEKTKRFGYLSFLAGVAFIAGSFLGGKLTDSSLWSWLDLASPLWFAAVLTLSNFFVVALFFKETARVRPSVRFHLFESIENIRKALRTEKIKSLFLIYFLFLFAWTLVFQLSPVLVIRRFDFSRFYIGELAAFMGLMWALGSSYLNRVLLKRFAAVRVLEAALLIFTVFNCLIGFSHNVYVVVAVLGLCGLIGGLAWPICTGLISSRFAEDMQGKVLGISQSMLSLAMGLSSIVGGSIYVFSSATPYVLAALFSLSGVVLYVKLNFRSHL
jgi:DHA1 family tetracycline resistance protein-like MFS transporter